MLLDWDYSARQLPIGINCSGGGYNQINTTTSVPLLEEPRREVKPVIRPPPGLGIPSPMVSKKKVFYFGFVKLIIFAEKINI